MLILTRRAGVTGALGTNIQIGDDVWIKSGIVERTRDGYQQNKPLDAYFKAIQKYGVIAGVNRGKHYVSCKKHSVQRVSSLSPVKTSV